MTSVWMTWHWVPVVVWAAVILLVSSLPGVDVSHLTFDWSDKLAHLAEYAILGVLLARMLSLTGKRTSIVVAVSIQMGIGLAALDELHQIPIPNRYCEWSDFLSDGVGVLLGVVVYGLYRKARK